MKKRSGEEILHGFNIIHAFNNPVSYQFPHRIPSETSELMFSTSKNPLEGPHGKFLLPTVTGPKKK